MRKIIGSSSSKMKGYLFFDNNYFFYRHMIIISQIKVKIRNSFIIKRNTYTDIFSIRKIKIFKGFLFTIKSKRMPKSLKQFVNDLRRDRRN